ncbi:hypothetical protein HanPSC8_Chr01g0010171 [Helianthus annuus]|nr:hypothetical protein HanPSC8_Chr01g0010171 [Helianthus annuus]
MSQALNFHASTICSESYYFKLTHIIKKILHSNISLPILIVVLNSVFYLY